MNVYIDLCSCIKTNEKELSFLYFLYLFFWLFTFENDLNLFWVYHFGKNQEKGHQFHFLPRAPDTNGKPLPVPIYWQARQNTSEDVTAITKIMGMSTRWN